MLVVMRQTSTRQEIAANVRAALAYRGLEQAALAPVIGKSESAVSTRLRGVAHFRVEELQAIAAFLDVPLEQLLAPASTEASA